MKPVIDITRIEQCAEWMEQSAESATSVQSLAWFMDHISNLAKTLAWLNGQMAATNEVLNKEKVKAYHTLAASSTANQKYYAPTLAKEYIAARVSDAQYQYDMAERASRTCTHQLDVFRSVMTTLREEAKLLNLQ